MRAVSVSLEETRVRSQPVLLVMLGRPSGRLDEPIIVLRTGHLLGARITVPRAWTIPNLPHGRDGAVVPAPLLARALMAQGKRGRVRITAHVRCADGSAKSAAVSFDIDAHLDVSFDLAAPMLIPRASHAAVARRESVVALGGRPPAWDIALRTGAHASTETWSPGGAWRRGADLVRPRAGHSAVARDDGTLLVLGGTSRLSQFDGRVLEVESGDPEGGFRDCGALRVAHGRLAVAPLPDGRLLIVGSGGPGELFDPAKGSSRFVDALPAFASCTATTLADGTVLIVGEADVLRWDSKTERVVPAARLQNGRRGHAATLLPDGRLLITGGIDPARADCVWTAELYDPTRDVWIDAGLMRCGRSSHQAVLRGQASVVLVGGCARQTATRFGSTQRRDSDDVVYKHDVTIADVEQWDASPGGDGGSFTGLSALPEIRDEPAVARLASGAVIVTGGADDAATVILKPTV